MSTKLDPRRRKSEHRELEITSIMYAAKAGALSSMQRYLMTGIDLAQCNYDGRTALHVAAAEGTCIKLRACLLFQCRSRYHVFSVECRYVLFNGIPLKKRGQRIGKQNDLEERPCD